MREVVVTEHEAGQRLDRLLRKLLRNTPLGAIFRLLRSGAIRIDGRKVGGDLRLVAGMRLELRVPDGDLSATPATGARPPRRAVSAAPTAWPAALTPCVVHRDDDLLALAKPAGLAVHGGSGVRHSVAAWLDGAGFGVRTSTWHPAPAHRLDRATSGLLLVGLQPAATRALAASFRDGAVAKTYYAVVEGAPPTRAGEIDAPLALRPNATADGPKVVVDPAGEVARTGYEVVAATDGLTLVRLQPREGRQHQLRAHLAHLGCPILGDRRYGARRGAGGGFFLHCAALVLPHPRTGAPIKLATPVPAGWPLSPPSSS
ncbi:MAG: RluA family pseudouridine synthase [Planctomycetes bacterium]|nr:RluA family pseudouridine synthase [Planctomycetota bacterium]